MKSESAYPSIGSTKFHGKFAANLKTGQYALLTTLNQQTSRISGKNNFIVNYPALHVLFGCYLNFVFWEMYA